MMHWPPIPETVAGILGPITVVRVEQPVGDEGPEDLAQGTWRGTERRIEVQISKHPLNEWFVFYHELFHSWLEDLGVKLPPAKEEELCDTYARGRVLEMQRPA